MKKDPLVLALKKLSYRAYSQKEIDEYLFKIGFDLEQRKKVLQRLTEWRYIDDQKLANIYCEYYFRQKHLGFSLVYKKLLQKGIPHEYIVDALDKYDEQTELESAQSSAIKFMRKRVAQLNQGKDALARHLQRKGFPTAIILKIINDPYPENLLD